MHWSNVMNILGNTLSVNQSTNQPSIQPAGQPASQPTNQSTNQSETYHLPKGIGSLQERWNKTEKWRKIKDRKW